MTKKQTINSLSIYFSIVVLIMSLSKMQAQQLMRPIQGFSGKKITYVTLEDGSQVQGNLKNFKVKKGLIEEIKMRGLDGKKQKIKPEKIKHIYVPVSGLGKIVAFQEFLGDATQWSNTDLDRDIFGKGYVYFEKSEVRVKKKTRTLMMQLLNPGFSEKIKIYDDPRAGESMGIGIGSLKVAGGDAKAYYVKKGEVATKIQRKMYDEEYKLLFEDCPDLVQQIGATGKWIDFAKHVFDYTKQCE